MLFTYYLLYFNTIDSASAYQTQHSFIIDITEKPDRFIAQTYQ